MEKQHLSHVSMLLTESLAQAFTPSFSFKSLQQINEGGSFKRCVSSLNLIIKFSRLTPAITDRLYFSSSDFSHQLQFEKRGAKRGKGLIQDSLLSDPKSAVVSAETKKKEKLMAQSVLKDLQIEKSEALPKVKTKGELHRERKKKVDFIFSLFSFFSCSFFPFFFCFFSFSNFFSFFFHFFNFFFKVRRNSRLKWFNLGTKNPDEMDLFFFFFFLFFYFFFIF